jgi:RNA polymerase sigma-54 factor
MGPSPKLELRQGQRLSQNLSLTPQLLQAIKLLQMSQAELAAFIEAEIEKNPMLECEEASREEMTLDMQANDNGVSEGDWAEPSRDGSEIAATLDTEVENIFPEDETLSPQQASSPSWEISISPYWQENADFENFDSAEGPPSLGDMLTQQLHLAEQNLHRRFVGQQIIELVDEAGYISTPLEPLAERLGVSFETVLSALELLQGFDPPGICARNLQECLILQLKEKNRFDPAMEKLIAHLELVAKADLTALKRICGVDAEDIADMIAELRQLNPKPGLAFSSPYSDSGNLRPDVFVKRSAKNEWHVELNSDALPRLLINETYAAKITLSARTPIERQFVSTCLQNANWLVKSLDQRAKTVLKTASEIIKKQQGFFEHGVAELKPMSLRDIAEAIEMHESTVSRVTMNKFMATPRGIFEFRYFFSTAVASNTGEALSSESVRHKIKALIDNEKPANILSDEAIVDILKSDGLVIARRTVAKYRDMMNIPTSAERKRQKRV